MDLPSSAVEVAFTVSLPWGGTAALENTLERYILPTYPEVNNSESKCAEIGESGLRFSSVGSESDGCGGRILGIPAYGLRSSGPLVLLINLPPKELVADKYMCIHIDTFPV